MLERHHPRLALACSFQKEEAVLIDMLMRTRAGRARVHDRHRRALPRDLPGLARARAPLRRARRDLRRRCARTAAPWSAAQCCSERKVAALDRALDGLDGWITGLRREQAPTRAGTPEARLRRAPRHLEGEPARRLGRQRGVGLHRPPRRPLQPAARPRLRVDRLRARARFPGPGAKGAGPAATRPSAASTSEATMSSNGTTAAAARLTHLACA